MSIFKSVATRKPSKNQFDLSHEVKLSANWANLYPVFKQEVIPEIVSK